MKPLITSIEVKDQKVGLYDKAILNCADINSVKGIEIVYMCFSHVQRDAAVIDDPLLSCRIGLHKEYFII